jgi:hypothetical protein
MPWLGVFLWRLAINETIRGPQNRRQMPPESSRQINAL